ncbi:unnamed protein product [Mycena citricolor]|uniref:Alpha/beta-hydrolase n=1 Tax=Mycena citricolor TaxID=2018698 RepID=A0AAD2H979_9AGAR|nr:unnamed protein product [Mycena citricolor]
MNNTDVPYKQLRGGSEVCLDVYPPAAEFLTGSVTRLPAVVYYHGGGMTVGTRTSWFPTWLQTRLNAKGILFISADYQLIPASSMHDVIRDVQDLFAFLGNEATVFKVPGDAGRTFGVDMASVAVAGSSAGGYVAYLTALHATPKPKAVLSLYGLGADFLNHQTLGLKFEPFFLGREMLDPIDFAEFVYPENTKLDPTSESTLTYFPTTHPTKPGWPSNPRLPLCRLLLQMGVFLDYLAGQHEPSLSLALRPLLEKSSDPAILQEELGPLVPEEHRRIFPQLNITPEFPPTFFFHGSEDTAVLPSDSVHLHSLLKGAGVETKIIIIDGASHSLDYHKDAETMYKAHFEEMAGFLATAVLGS